MTYSNLLHLFTFVHLLPVPRFSHGKTYFNLELPFSEVSLLAVSS